MGRNGPTSPSQVYSGCPVCGFFLRLYSNGVPGEWDEKSEGAGRAGVKLAVLNEPPFPSVKAQGIMVPEKRSPD